MNLQDKKAIILKYLKEELQKILIEIEILNLQKDFLKSILYIINELFVNVIEHSFAKKVFVEIKIKFKKI